MWNEHKATSSVQIGMTFVSTSSVQIEMATKATSSSVQIWKTRATSISPHRNTNNSQSTSEFTIKAHQTCLSGYKRLQPPLPLPLPPTSYSNPSPPSCPSTI